MRLFPFTRTVFSSECPVIGHFWMQFIFREILHSKMYLYLMANFRVAINGIFSRLFQVRNITILQIVWHLQVFQHCGDFIAKTRHLHAQKTEQKRFNDCLQFLFFITTDRFLDWKTETWRLLWADTRQLQVWSSNLGTWTSHTHTHTHTHLRHKHTTWCVTQHNVHGH